MISVGKYMAAAKGGPNMAAKIAPDARKLLTRSNHPRHPGNMAGYEGGKSAWIQMNGAGYGRRPRKSNFVRSGGISSYRPNAKGIRMNTDMRKPDFSRVTSDQDLSRLL